MSKTPEEKNTALTCGASKYKEGGWGGVLTEDGICGSIALHVALVAEVFLCSGGMLILAGFEKGMVS